MNVQVEEELTTDVVNAVSIVTAAYRQITYGDAMTSAQIIASPLVAAVFTEIRANAEQNREARREMARMHTTSVCLL